MYNIMNIGLLLQISEHPVKAAGVRMKPGVGKRVQKNGRTVLVKLFADQIK
jgi:hypothetical protein